MALGDFFARLGGQPEARPPEPVPAAPGPPGPPSRDDLGAALDRVEGMVAGGAVPSCVAARVERVTHVVRDTIPRLGQIRGSASAYSVMATATDYLPEALGGYLRLPRRFADSRPVDGGKTSLMVLVDQLDLLGATMDSVFDAVCRDDATALVAHGRFLSEKFGHASTGGVLDAAGVPTPALPPEMPAASAAPASPAPASPAPASSAPASPPEAPQEAPALPATAASPPAGSVNPETPGTTGGPHGDDAPADSPAPGALDLGPPTRPDPEPQRLAPPTWI